MYSLDASGLIATAIRDVLQQHGDICAELSPRELRAQLIARMAPGTDVVEAYLRQLDRAIEEQEAIVPRRASLVRDAANLRTLRGHTRQISHVVALDRDRALSASHDTTLRLWDLATGKTLRVLKGHPNWVNHVVALDRDRALSASDDKNLRLWDLATGKTLRVLQGHSDRVSHVVALDRDRALSASYDKTLRLWDLATGKTLRVLQGHSTWVNHVVALDRNRALSASWDTTLRLWDLNSGLKIARFTGDAPMLIMP